MLMDPFGRPITYLRVSITDRCNLRCVYCMPPDGVTTLSHDDIMRYEEITAFVRTAARLGIRSVRITGGEPLVRKGVVDLVHSLAEIPGIEDISLTTNAVLLEQLAVPLKKAGLRRINVSIDTLDSEKFNRITRGGSLETTWKGIEAADQAGLSPIKLNTVVLRGVNEDELLDLARLTLDRPWEVRFIELMPVSNQSPWGPGFPSPKDAYLSIQEMLSILAPLQLERLEGSNGREHVGSGPAREYRARGARGLIGFISPLGEHFCGSCNRLRLTADGCLRPCLLSDLEIPVLPALRAGADIEPLIRQAVLQKPQGHELNRSDTTALLDSATHPGRCMRQIGG